MSGLKLTLGDVADGLVLAAKEELLPPRFLEDLCENLNEAANGLKGQGATRLSIALGNLVARVQRAQRDVEGTSYDA